MGRSVPEPEPEPERHGNHSDCGSKQYEPRPEPHPQWKAAKTEWGAAWEAHVYVFALAFLLLALAAVYLLTKRKEGRFKYWYFSTLQVLLLIIGATRFFILILDPYGSMDPVAFPLPMQKLIFGLALPCLLSSFSLIFLTLIEASKVRFVSRNVMNWKVIGILCTIHFVSNITGDLLISLEIKPRLVALVCYFYLCLWGLFLFIGFPAVGHKIIFNLIHTSRSVKRKAKKEPLLKVARLTYGSAVCGVFLLAAQVYFVLDIYGKANRNSSDCHSDPWLWWSFQCVARLGEIVMSVLLLYSTYDPHSKSYIHCCTFKLCSIEPKHELQITSPRKKTLVFTREECNGDKNIQPVNPVSVDSGVCVMAETEVSSDVAVFEREECKSSKINCLTGTPEPLLKAMHNHRISYQDISICAKSLKCSTPPRSISVSAIVTLQRRDTDTTVADSDSDSPVDLV